MNLFLEFIFIFYGGCTLGWFLEIIYRRLAHGKWVNPGFLIGPYLPIYGFGLATLTSIYYIFKDTSTNPIIVILLMGVIMTLIEFVGGLIGLANNVKLWDYSNQWGNYKGIICPLFSAIWTGAGALYYFVLASHVTTALEWFSHNLAFSYTLGIFTGCIVIDFVYASKLYLKIRAFAKENEIIVKYEQLKMNIKEAQAARKEKYSFINPFKQTLPLKEYLSNYMESIKDKTTKKIEKKAK